MSTINSYRLPKTEVRESGIQGKGLFAREFIRKGEIIAIKGGHIITLQEFKELDEKVKHYCGQIEDNFFIGPKKEEEIESNAIFINLSCDPNIGFDGQITYVALRGIEPGEELCHDAAMMFSTELYNLKCNCGSKDCRKTVTGNDWKRKDLQEKYGNHFVWSILKKIKSVKQ